jgi:hypothetical protein
MEIPNNQEMSEIGQKRSFETGSSPSGPTPDPADGSCPPTLTPSTAPSPVRNGFIRACDSLIGDPTPNTLYLDPQVFVPVLYHEPTRIWRCVYCMANFKKCEKLIVHFRAHVSEANKK